jgi:hypothetical protein
VQLHLGEFEDFKFGGKLLLSGGAADVKALADLLAEFVASGDDSVAIHSRANVAPRHPAKLYAVSSPAVSVDGPALLCTPESLPEISGKLEALSSGHQYFELIGTSSELLVSVGEYDLAWWRAQA